jgi:hypothetical protein
MQHVGAYQSVAFDDPAIHLTVEDIGGWPSLCRTLIDDLPFVQKRFTEAYRMHAARPETPHPARLIGATEIANQSAKLTAAQQQWLTDQTVLIGAPDVARQVMATGNSAARHEMTAIATSLVPPVRRLTNGVPA